MAFQMHLDTEHPQPEQAYREFALDRLGKIIFVGHHSAPERRSAA